MFDVVLVGGGVIGLSLAWELSRRKKTVCVVDRYQPGRGTSWVGAGILPPPRTQAEHDPMEALRSVSHQLHLQWSETLRAETGLDNELRRCGGIYLARRAGEAAALRVEMAQAAAEGVTTSELSRSELIDREPALASIAEACQTAYWLPDEMQLRSPRHLQALMAACVANRVEIRPNCEVRKILITDNRVTGLETEKESLRANEYCLCSGPWAANLLGTLGICLPTEPWRGQLIIWKTPRPMISHVVNEGLRYLVPRSDGHLLTGATVEDVGYDCRNTDEAVQELRAYARELLPDLERQHYQKAGAGLRSKTPDGCPFMGRVPGVDNLSVSAGHFRSGLHLSPISAVFMADLLIDDKPSQADWPIDPAPFRIHR